MHELFYRGNRDSRQRVRTSHRALVGGLGERVQTRGIGADPTSWDPLFKDDYTPKVIQNTLNQENQALNFMTNDTSTEGWDGRQKIIPKKVGRNFASGSIGVRGPLPNQGRSTYQDSKIPMRDFYGRVGFEIYVMKQSKAKKGSWAYVVTQEMDGMIEDMAFRRNIIAWGAGLGILAVVNGTHTATTTLTVKNPLNVTGTVNTNRYLQGDANGGMYIAILDSATQAIKATATVTDTTSATSLIVTVDTPITAADGDFVVTALTPTAHSYNKEPEGMLAGIDDGTYVGTYHNISRTTFPLEKAYVLTGVGPLSLDAIQQPIDATSIRVGKGVDLFACEHAVRRAYMALLELDRRYTGADLKSPDGGTTAAKKPTGRTITYGDIPFLVDRDAPYQMLFGIRKDSWSRFALVDGEWADEGGSVLRQVPGFDDWSAFYRILENFHNYAPPRNFRMEGITVNQLVGVRSF